MLCGFAIRSKGACHLLHLPAVCKLAPGGLVGWSGLGFWRDAVLGDGTIGQQGVVESLLRCLVLILEWGDGAVLSDPLPGMQCQILLRVGDGLRHFLLHEILLNQILEPYCLPLFAINAHQLFIVLQKIRPDVTVEKLDSGHCHGMHFRSVEIESWDFSHRLLIDGLDDGIVRVIMLCNMVEKISGTICNHFFSLFGIFCILEKLSILA